MIVEEFGDDSEHSSEHAVVNLLTGSCKDYTKHGRRNHVEKNKHCDERDVDTHVLPVISVKTLHPCQEPLYNSEKPMGDIEPHRQLLQGIVSDFRS